MKTSACLKESHKAFEHLKVFMAILHAFYFSASGVFLIITLFNSQRIHVF